MAVWFTNRRGGVSEPPYAELNLGLHVGDDPEAVAQNRRRLEAVTGGRRIVWMDQVHGRRVAVVDGPQEGAIPETDALVTTTPDLVLAVLVADCVPVMLRGPISEGPASGSMVVAAAHAGRRGLQLGVGEAVVSPMSSMGVQPKAMVAELGPAVCGKCYEVPSSMREEVAAVAPAARSTARSGRPSLDLRAGLVQQLHALGVSKLKVDPTCTFESPEHFSHRRDQRTGRGAGLIVIDG
jgi:YfiH family protein